MLATSLISPLASGVGLPISRVISAARSSIRSLYSSATRSRTLARSSFAVVRQDWKARAERSSTCWTSASVAVANSRSVSLVAGLTTLYWLTLISLRLSLPRLLPVPGLALALHLVQLLTIIPRQWAEGWGLERRPYRPSPDGWVLS